MPEPTRRTAPAPFFPVAEVPVEFDPLLVCFAAAWKASNVFALDSFAFAAKTMPSAQWPIWRQYAQIGEVSFTWMVYVGNVVAFALTGMLNQTELYGVSDTLGCMKERRQEEDVQLRVKAGLATCRTRRELLARIGEAGLRDCVILLVELKGNGVAWLRGDIRGLEGQSGATNNDFVILRRGGGGIRGSSGTGSCA